MMIIKYFFVLILIVLSANAKAESGTSPDAGPPPSAINKEINQLREETIVTYEQVQVEKKTWMNRLRRGCNKVTRWLCKLLFGKITTTNQYIPHFTRLAIELEDADCNTSAQTCNRFVDREGGMAMSEQQLNDLAKSAKIPFVVKNGKIYDKENNKIYKISDFNDRKSMEAAGFPKSALDELDKMEQDINKEAKNKAAAVLKKYSDIGASGTQGTSLSGSKSSTSTTSSNDTVDAASGASTKKFKAAASDFDPNTLTSGLSINYQGEPIGIKNDDIFKMITKRYKVREKKENFHQPENSFITQ